MTEYEFMSALQGQTALVSTGLMNFFTILTAYLAAGYLAGHRLTLPLALFVTAMFVLAASFYLVALMGAYNATKALLGQMHALVDAGKGLAWLPAAKRTPDIVDPFMYVALALMLGGIIGSIYFFFHARHANRRANPVPAPTAA